MSTITTIQTTDTGASSLTQLNTNILNLNTDKQEKGTGATGNIVAFGSSNILQDTGKTLPTSAVVGITDTQTLSNKTLTAPVITSPVVTGAFTNNGTYAGSAVVPVANGGTGLTTLPANGVLVGNGTSSPTSTATGSAGQVLTSTGASSAPTFQAQSTTQIVLTSTAFENLTIGDAVCPIIGPANFIALDAKANGVTNSLTYTTPFTVGANANRGLVVMCVSQNNSTTVSSVTYNGVAMTAIVFVTSTGYKTYAFYLQAPSTGINNLVISCSATTPVSWWANSYYNVSQTSQPESSTSLTSGTTMTLTTANYFDLAVGVKVGTGSTGNGFTNNIVYDGFNTTAGDTGTLTYTGTTATFTSVGGEGVAMILSPFTASGTIQGVIRTAATSANLSNAFIGFANATVARGASVQIVVQGVFTNFSGLITGTQYYLSNSFGLLSSSVGTITRKAAIALSTTTALITNIW